MCGGCGKIGSGILIWEGGGGCLNQDLRDLGISRIADWLRVDKRCRCGGWSRRQLDWACRGCPGAGRRGGDGAGEGVAETRGEGGGADARRSHAGRMDVLLTDQGFQFYGHVKIIDSLAAERSVGGIVSMRT